MFPLPYIHSYVEILTPVPQNMTYLGTRIIAGVISSAMMRSYWHGVGGVL